MKKPNQKKEQQRAAKMRNITPDETVHTSGEAESRRNKKADPFAHLDQQEREKVETFLRDHPEYAPARDTNFQKPVYLGGEKGKYAVPLPESEKSYSLLQPNGHITNLEEILRAAGFDQLEIDYLIANQIDCIPRCDIHRHLGWTPAGVERVRKAIDKKRKGITMPPIHVERSGGSSLVLSYEEQLASGRHAASIADVPLTEAFDEEMNRARSKSLFVTDLPNSSNSRHINEGVQFTMDMDITEDAVQAEIARMLEEENWGRWQTPEWIEDTARTRLKNRAQAEQETQMRQYIRDLPDTDFPAQHEACEAAFISLRQKHQEAKQALQTKQEEHLRASANVPEEQRLADYISREIAKADQLVKDLGNELGSVTRRVWMFREDEKYRQKLALQRAVAAAEDRSESDLLSKISKLARQVYGVHPAMGSLAQTKLFSKTGHTLQRATMIAIVRLLARLGAMEMKEVA